MGSKRYPSRLKRTQSPCHGPQGWAPGKAGISGLHSRLPRGVRPRLEGKQRTPLSSRVATRISWCPLSGLKGAWPGEQSRVLSPNGRGGWSPLRPLRGIGEGTGNPLQCDCLENPRDGGAWWAAIYGVSQSWTRLPAAPAGLCQVSPSNTSAPTGSRLSAWPQPSTYGLGI